MTSAKPSATEVGTPEPKRLSRVGRIGAGLILWLRDLLYEAGVVGRLTRICLSLRAWPRTTRNVLARQVFFTGVGAVRFTLLIAFLVGISIVLQADLWLKQAGQGELLGPVLVAVVVRELGPLLVNIVILVRSGSAIVTELATMTVGGEVRLLESQGVDPLEYLVLPRVLGVTVSVACLTVLFIIASLASGFVASLGLQSHGDVSFEFLDSVLSAVKRSDLFHVTAKTVLPALLTSTICCIEGMGAGSARTEIPRAATRALSRAIGALFISSATVSIFSYL
ncbi:MAG: phospholipid/cholesterol/gamma-HCH transport system permease protein [Planctomycetota bacterium]|jgi:phospholipid/cholesterol/gamma-HCH transport system permease protein